MARKLESYVRRAMAEKGLTQQQIEVSTKGAIRQPVIAGILRGKYPQSSGPLIALAKALGLDPKDVLAIAARDHIDSLLHKMQVDISTVWRIPEYGTYTIPVFHLSELKVTKDGYPIVSQKTKRMKVLVDLGPYAYGVLLDASPIRLLNDGDIVVFSPDHPRTHAELCIVGDKDGNVWIGEAKEDSRSLKVTIDEPYDIVTIPKKNVAFAHRQVLTVTSSELMKKLIVDSEGRQKN